MGDAPELFLVVFGLFSTNNHLLTDSGEDTAFYFTALIVFTPADIIICHFWEITQKWKQLSVNISSRWNED